MRIVLIVAAAIITVLWALVITASAHMELDLYWRVIHTVGIAISGACFLVLLLLPR